MNNFKIFINPSGNTLTEVSQWNITEGHQSISFIINNMHYAFILCDKPYVEVWSTKDGEPEILLEKIDLPVYTENSRLGEILRTVNRLN